MKINKRADREILKNRNRKRNWLRTQHNVMQINQVNIN